MPRDIPIGNGQMLVNFDQHYRIRDLYFPHVGQENHAGAGPCRFGVWAAMPANAPQAQDRRKQRLFWSDQGWNIKLAYQADTLATEVTLTHDQLALELRCTDVVDFHRPIMVRRIDVTNQSDTQRDVHIFHHNDFELYGTRVGDTAYYDPQTHSVIHYRNLRYLMTTWWTPGNSPGSPASAAGITPGNSSVNPATGSAENFRGDTHIDQYATGFAGFRGAEGTWRDAEDGSLGNNPIAQGAVDSTIMHKLTVGPRATATAYMIIAAGTSYNDLQVIYNFLHRETPQGVIDRTVAYWRLWLAASSAEFPGTQEGGPSDAVVNLFKRSLLVVRTQIDNSGAIIAANDSDIMQFQRDTYSYLWPRDGALVAAALDDAGFSDVARSFYGLCARIISDQGYFLHKYNPDGSPASSWHPWVSMDKPQLPIQEDETALVIWALWRHYVRFRDIEFVRPLWMNLITRAADFLVRFRDPRTHLPLPSYDLWEERWGVHAHTVAAVHGGLSAAWQFAVCFGDNKRAAAYASAKGEIREAFCKHFWSDEHDRFLRRIVPLDHARTARLMKDVLAGQTPTEPEMTEGGDASGSDTSGGEASGGGGDAPAAVRPLEFEREAVVDSSMYAIFAMGLLDVNDPRVEKTMRAIESKLTVHTPVGGVARYEADHYHRVMDDTKAVPGNPWFICTLWLAEWKIAKATTVEELMQALPIFDWVASHALPSGVLAEQVHPQTNSPLSVSPLTWSHATVVSTLMAYAKKHAAMTTCKTCGQPRHCSVTGEKK